MQWESDLGVRLSVPLQSFLAGEESRSWVEMVYVASSTEA